VSSATAAGSAAPSTRVLIADDQQLVRTGFRLAVLAVLIRSSLAPPSGSCSARGDLLVDDATAADIAFRWGFTNLGRFARDYTGPMRRTPRR
jgi:AraC-like DNA-binding protein